MPQERKYKVSINITAINSKNYNEQLGRAIRTIEAAGLETEVSSHIISNKCGFSMYNACIKGYEVVREW